VCVCERVRSGRQHGDGHGPPRPRATRAAAAHHAATGAPHRTTSSGRGGAHHPCG
jgi:hypothetical protein